MITILIDILKTEETEQEIINEIKLILEDEFEEFEIIQILIKEFPPINKNIIKGTGNTTIIFNLNPTPKRRLLGLLSVDTADISVLKKRIEGIHIYLQSLLVDLQNIESLFIRSKMNYMYREIELKKALRDARLSKKRKEREEKYGRE